VYAALPPQKILITGINPMNHTTHQQQPKLTALASSLLALLTVTSVQVANECSLEYGFHIGEGAKQTPA